MDLSSDLTLSTKPSTLCAILTWKKTLWSKNWNLCLERSKGALIFTQTLLRCSQPKLSASHAPSRLFKPNACNFTRAVHLLRKSSSKIYAKNTIGLMLNHGSPGTTILISTLVRKIGQKFSNTFTPLSSPIQSSGMPAPLYSEHAGRGSKNFCLTTERMIDTADYATLLKTKIPCTSTSNAPL